MDTGPWDEAKLNEYDFYFQEIIFFSDSDKSLRTTREKEKYV